MKKIKNPRWRLLIWKTYFYILPVLKKNKLLWKDKFDTPRCEKVPTVELSWLWWTFYWFQGSESFWEQWLWLTVYCDSDIKEAEETWGWIDYKTKKSTWVPFDILQKALD